MSDEITNLTSEEKEALGITDTPAEANNTEEEKKEEKQEEPAKKEEEKEAEDDSKDEEEIPDDADDDKAPRRPQVPYHKFKEEREARKALEKEIEELKTSGKTKEEQTDDIEKIAEEYGVDPTFTKKLADSILSKNKPQISEEELKEFREQRQLTKQNELFNDEFDSLVELKPEVKEYKAKIKKLAFSTQYAGKNFKTLAEIYLREIEPNIGRKKTMEGGEKRTDTQVVDYETITEAEALKLSADEFLKWSEYKAKQS